MLPPPSLILSNYSCHPECSEGSLQNNNAKIPPSLRSLGMTKAGFTLIELSIVLVIIGLVVGGVLVGKDLIKAAQIRAQIAQIEQFNTAANTFKLKYGALPGDIKNTDAVAFGFSNAGSWRYNDGIIGYSVISLSCYNCRPHYPALGETNLFWVDLGNSGLINGKFTFNNGSTPPWNISGNPSNLSVSGDNVKFFLPPAKLGGDKYVFVWS